MLIAAVFGYFVESNTNDMAKLKQDNVSGCIANMGERAVMNETDLNCVSTTTDTDKLPLGTTKAEMQQYVARQKHEASEVELSRIGGWALAGATELVWPTIIYQAIT